MNRLSRPLAGLATATVLIALGTGTAFASDLCNVPESDRQPVDALQQKLESEGWTVKNIKVDDGCYEAYATDADGKRMETYFDPKTFDVVKADDD